MNALAESGITLEENSTVMQMWISGNGLYEDAVLTEICSEAFGGIYGTWTCEEQDWFDRQMQKVGCTETYRCRLPGPDNRTSEEAEAFALEALREAYGQDLPLEDRGVWLLTRQFDRAAGKASKGLGPFPWCRWTWSTAGTGLNSATRIRTALSPLTPCLPRTGPGPIQGSSC